MKFNPERKTKKLSMSCKPSTYDQIKKISIAQENTVNAIINHALSEYIENHKADLDKFEKMRGVVEND